MYDASQGRGSGGNINVVLRSGTDKFHGGAYEFYRSNDMNANDFFANLAGKPVPVLLQNQFGGEVGGPVPKVKDTFWFFSYQGTRQKNGVSSLISGSQPVLPGVRTAATLGSAFGVNPASIDPVAVNILNAKGPYGGLLYPSGTCAGVAGCTGPGSIGSLVMSYADHLQRGSGGDFRGSHSVPEQSHCCAVIFCQHRSVQSDRRRTLWVKG